MFKRELFIFIAIILLFNACTGRQDKIDIAQGLVLTNPDSALIVLQAMDTLELEQLPEAKARYALLLFSIQEAQGTIIKRDSLFRFSFNYFQQQPKDEISFAYICYYGALAQMDRQQNDDAAELLLTAEEISLRKKDNLLLGKTHYRLGRLLNAQNNSEIGREYFNSSISHFRKAGNIKGENDALLGLSYTYTVKQHYDSALIFLRQAMRLTNSPASVGEIYQETGRMYYAANQNDSALLYLRKSLNFPMVKYQAAMRYDLLGEVFFTIEQYDSAKVYVKKSLEYLSTPKIQRNCYAVLANVAYLEKDFDEYAILFNQYQTYADSAALALSQRRLVDIKELRLVANASSESLSRIKRVAVVALPILLLLLVVIWLYYRFRFIQKNQKLAEKEMKMQQKIEKKEVELQQQLEREKRELLIQQLHEQIEQESARLASKRKMLKSVSEKENHDRTVLLSVLHLKDINEPEAFFDFVEPYLNGLPQRLLSTFPTMNNEDRLLCCLSQLNLTNDKISLLFQVKETALLKRKQRLAAKLGFDNVKVFHAVLVEMEQSNN